MLCSWIFAHKCMHILKLCWCGWLAPVSQSVCCSGTENLLSLKWSSSVELEPRDTAWLACVRYWSDHTIVANGKLRFVFSAKGQRQIKPLFLWQKRGGFWNGLPVCVQNIMLRQTSFKSLKSQSAQSTFSPGAWQQAGFRPVQCLTAYPPPAHTHTVIVCMYLLSVAWALSPVLTSHY
jgi:hypothetical protein